MSQNQIFPYEDILHLPYPRPSRLAKMSMIERAAQFAPFAALTGFDSAIEETARLTGQRAELDESEKAALDQKLQLLVPHLPDTPCVTITYFQQDIRKEGGQYITTTGHLQKIDFYRGCLILEDRSIPIQDVFRLECPLIPE